MTSALMIYNKLTFSAINIKDLASTCINKENSYESIYKMIKYYSYPELSPSINLKRFFEKDVQTVILISFIEMVEFLAHMS